MESLFVYVIMERGFKKNWLNGSRSPTTGYWWNYLNLNFLWGKGNGFDLEMLELIYGKINVPFIMHGAGNEQHIYDVLKYDKVSGVAISLLHYSLIREKNLNIIL